MKKNYLLGVLFILLINNNLFAQSGKKPTEAEINKMARDMEQRAKSGKPMSEKELKEMMKKLGGEEMASMPIPTQKQELPKAKLKYNVTDQPLHGKPLADFVATMVRNLNKNMDTADARAVKGIIAELDSSVSKIEEIAVYAFYKGAHAQGVLLAANAVLIDPKNDLHVNNLAGMLINLGAFEHALPVMRGLVSRYPADDMMCNNLGQAYMGLGKKDSALKYLERALKGSPGHPQALATASKINQAKGNKQVALAQAKEALKNSINLEAAEFIDENDKSPDAFSFLIDNNKAPDYFNMYKIKKPIHPTSIKQAEQAMAEKLAFGIEIERMRDELGELQNKEQKLGEEELDRQVKKFKQTVFSTGKAPKTFLSIASQVAVRVMAKNQTFLYHRKLKIYEEAKKYEEYVQNETKILAIDLDNIRKAYKEKMKPYICGEGTADQCVILENLTRQSCKDQDARINVYLSTVATAAEAFDTKQLQYAREYFYFYSKWYVMAAPNQHLANAAYYSAADDYLEAILKIKEYPVYGPTCERLLGLLEKYTFEQLVAPPCPINAELAYGVVNIKASCKEFEIEVSVMPDYALNFKKDFESSNSTLSVVHTYFDKGFEIPGMIAKTIGLELGAKAEVKESLYLTVDGDGKMSDMGYRVNTKVEAKAEIDNGDIHKGGSIKVEGEISIGINSGFNSSITPFASWL